MLSSFVTNLLYSVFLTTSFVTASENLLKSTGMATSLSISNLSTSVFKLAKFDFSAKLLTRTCDTFLNQFFCIIRYINFNINVSAKRFIPFRKILTHLC